MVPRMLARTRPSWTRSVPRLPPTPRRARFEAPSGTRSPSTARRAPSLSSPPRKMTKAMSKRPTQPPPTTMQERIVELRTRREQVMAGGGEKRHAKQHDAGKLTARERIAELVDPLSFEESGMHTQHRTTLFGMDTAFMPADGVVTGAASVLGRPARIAS